MSFRRRPPTIAILVLSLILVSGSPPSTDPIDARGIDRTSADFAIVLDAIATWRTAFDRDQSEEIASVLLAESRRTGLKPSLVLAVIQVESSGDITAVSHVGAIGLMQLRPTTAREVAGEAGVEWQGNETLVDPVSNVKLGITYLSKMVERFGDVDTALAAYNWGPTHIAQQIRRGRALPARYVTRVRDAHLAAI